MCIYFYGLYRSCCHDAALPILPENGLSNRIRGLFESAIATEMGSRCPLLWRMYVHFLVRQQINTHTNSHVYCSREDALLTLTHFLSLASQLKERYKLGEVHNPFWQLSSHTHNSIITNFTERACVFHRINLSVS